MMIKIEKAWGIFNINGYTACGRITFDEVEMWGKVVVVELLSIDGSLSEDPYYFPLSSLVSFNALPKEACLGMLKKNDKTEKTEKTSSEDTSKSSEHIFDTKWKN